MIRRDRGLAGFAMTALLGALLPFATSAAGERADLRADATAAPIAPTGMVSLPDAWGWVVVRQPTTDSYVPPAIDSRNSNGGTNTVTRISRGIYVVRFPGIDNGFDGDPGTGGTAIVTALSTQPRDCVIGDLGRQPPDFTVDVECFAVGGGRVDSRFAVNLVSSAEGGKDPSIAYLFANEPATAEYEPDPFYSYNPSGVANQVTRETTGRYRVSFAGMPAPPANAQVTAGTRATCRITEWADALDAQFVYATCRDRTGSPVDTTFMAVYAKDVGLTGELGRPAAYLLAGRPTTPSYRPGQWFSSAGVRPTVTRSGTGRYVATLPGLPRGGSAQLTAHGSGKSICMLRSIRTDGAPQKVGVACFKPNGAAVDSEFSLTYTK